MEFGITPIYEDVFSDESLPLSIEEIIKDIPTEALIKSCCYINATLYYEEIPFKQECKIFIHLIERITDQQRRNLYFRRLQAFTKRNQGNSLGIFPLPHTLKLIETAFLNFNSGQMHELTMEQELSILKSLLFINSTVDANLSKLLTSGADYKDGYGFYRVFWPSLLNSSVLSIKKDFVICIFKALHFLKYLQSKFPIYCNEYLVINKVKTTENILTKTLELYLNGYRKDINLFSFNYPAGQIQDNSVIEQFILPHISVEEYKKNGFDKNLKGIRTYPIIKFANGDYSITNWNFIVDKFYEGLVFDFYNKTGIKNQAEYKSFGNYKTKIGEVFSQQFFMKIMKEIFTQNGIVVLNEKERNQNCDYDFYIRIRNHIFLFEFKDVLLPINETYEEIKASIDEKLVSSKGLPQLKRQLTNLSNTPLDFDDCFSSDYPLERVFVYPVIVYTDISFGITGINDYLNERFNQILPDEVRNKFFWVSPLIMMHFDFFFEYYDALKSGKMDLVDVVTSCQQIKSCKMEFQKTWPSPTNYPNSLEGFDLIASSKYHPFKEKISKTALFEYIIQEIRPHLPHGEKNK